MRFKWSRVLINKKNIILIKTDQQRFDLLSYFKNDLPLQTPHLDAFFQRSHVMKQAHCVSPLCLPSRTAYFSGSYCHEMGAFGNSDNYLINKSLLDPLKDAGYQLSLIGKNHCFSKNYLDKCFSEVQQYGHWGKESGEIRESDKAVCTYFKEENRFANTSDLGKMEGLIDEAMPFEDHLCPSYRIVEDAINYIETVETKNDRFVLHLSFPEPHWPNVVCEPFFSEYRSKEVHLKAEDHAWENKPFAHFVQSRAYNYHLYTSEEKKKILQTYLAQIAFIDREVGRFFNYLKQKELYDEAIIVFSSDHGDYAGNYGLVAKTKAFYESLVKIPLAIKLPGQHEGSECEAMVENIDILPTILDYLNIPHSAKSGLSFLPCLLDNQKEHRETVFSEVGSPEETAKAIPRSQSFDEYAKREVATKGIFWFTKYTMAGRAFMLKNKQYKYCYYTGKPEEEEFYDYRKDELELKNRIDDSEYREVIQDLRSQLFSFIFNRV